MSDPDWITPDVSLDITVRLDTSLRVYDLYLGNHLLDEASDVSRATINAQAASSRPREKSKMFSIRSDMRSPLCLILIIG